MRYRGQEHTVAVPVEGALDHETLVAALHERHRRRYTFALEDTPVEIVNFRVTAVAGISSPPLRAPGDEIDADPRKGTRSVLFDAGGVSGMVSLATPIYDRALLRCGFAVAGPAIVEEPSTTTVVHPGQRLEVSDSGNMFIAVGDNR
jgi:N-methylhydantoinase A